ncbi:preprotein translocase subunit SecG [Spiroplasma endosymbiont of Crioceris asparagi]|uniref:preprotein translocase subunit SecG n=1 Tax=Spiroplasma endosymbiont of Crioceris asparagi TaxID=3066286 RepID=UPI003BAFDB3D
MLLVAASDKKTVNVVVFALEVFCLIISIIIIGIGMIQNKKSQTGLSALNGGNDELFSNSKERGLDKTLSTWMMVIGIVLAVIAITSAILTNIYLK